MFHSKNCHLQSFLLQCFHRTFSHLKHVYMMYTCGFAVIHTYSYHLDPSCTLLTVDFHTTTDFQRRRVQTMEPPVGALPGATFPPHRRLPHTGVVPNLFQLNRRMPRVPVVPCVADCSEFMMISHLSPLFRPSSTLVCSEKRLKS